jgi:hypothetical protein
MEVIFLNGYLPKSGDILPFLQVDGTITGDFAEVTFPNLAPGFEFQTQIVNGNYQITALNDAVAINGLLSISTRAQLSKKAGYTMSESFTLTGTEATNVLIRGLGPSLGSSNVLANPTLQLLDQAGVTIATNDDWKATQETEIQASGHAPANDQESAIVVALLPGTYTAALGGGTKKNQGIGLVEIYDLTQSVNSRLATMSSHGFVGKAGNELIGGFTIGGSGKTRVLLRGLGLKDPTLELANANRSSIFLNNNWQDTQSAAIQATGLAPGNVKESAIVANLDPGSYLAIVRGNKKKTGVGTVEVYTLP